MHVKVKKQVTLLPYDKFYEIQKNKRSYFRIEQETNQK